MGHPHGDRTANQRANETATAHGRDYSQRPLVVTWELTQACALACDHCRADASPDCHPDELSTAQAHALFDQVAAFGDPAPFLVFSGGDPLERDDLLELVRAAAERGVPPAVTPATTPALDRTTVERLAAAGVGRMAVSVDGATPATHDSFRGESGTFERALRAARAAADAGMTVQINTTVTAVTASELPAIAELAESLGAAMWEVFFLVPTGRGAALKQLAPERAGEIVGWLYERSREASYRVITVETPFYRRVAQQRGATPGRVGTTGAGNGFVFVSHTGEVFPSRDFCRSRSGTSVTGRWSTSTGVQSSCSSCATRLRSPARVGPARRAIGVAAADRGHTRQQAIRPRATHSVRGRPAGREEPKAGEENNNKQKGA